MANVFASGIKSNAALQPMRPTFNEITPRDIDLLSRYFSTKTIFDVKLDCYDEARQVLQASLTDPPIRHAVMSLRALREDFETSGAGPGPNAQRSATFNYGLQQYCMALGGIASNLSSLGSNGLKTTLLCCQIFISIEQVRGNFAVMAQHVVRGLRIMREYRARPYYVAAQKLVPAHRDHLPLLDVFIIKMFAAPCKFTEPPATVDLSRITSSGGLASPYPQPVESRHLRKINPNLRAELTRIAASTLEFLGKVSCIKSIGNALRLLSEKAALLDSLESWLIGLENFQSGLKFPGLETVSVSFMRLFHLILRIVLLGALDSSPDLDTKLQTENDRLQGLANNVGERLKAYTVALVRSSSSLATRPGLTVVTGSPLSKPDIRSALSAVPTLTPSAAIVTLNTVRKSDSPFAAQVSPPRFLADSCANVCEVLEHAGIHRIVVMSTAGVGDSWGKLPWMSKAFMGWTNIKYALEDHGLVDKEIRQTKMDWTLVRAVRLDFDDQKQKPGNTTTDVKTLGSNGDGMRMTDSVCIASVARFLVKVAVEELFVQSAVVVTN
ncbi:hypothetical protein JX265_006784 [Neoarthrinium moseri]|uniref:NAD(P)-binding domain-containing protein n=1 Tax=Neoarthrinium moseri TaxID=1658444 RepID=A0A9Q0ALH4_9PEZI|nr:hypothetical protein JX265_006784 [Neoarthrinium moseri]